MTRIDPSLGSTEDQDTAGWPERAGRRLARVEGRADRVVAVVDEAAAERVVDALAAWRVPGAEPSLEEAPDGRLAVRVPVHRPAGATEGWVDTVERAAQGLEGLGGEGAAWRLPADPARLDALEAGTLVQTAWGPSGAWVASVATALGEVVAPPWVDDASASAELSGVADRLAAALGDAVSRSAETVVRVQAAPVRALDTGRQGSRLRADVDPASVDPEAVGAALDRAMAAEVAAGAPVAPEGVLVVGERIEIGVMGIGAVGPRVSWLEGWSATPRVGGFGPWRVAVAVVDEAAWSPVVTALEAAERPWTLDARGAFVEVAGGPGIARAVGWRVEALDAEDRRLMERLVALDGVVGVRLEPAVPAELADGLGVQPRVGGGRASWWVRWWSAVLRRDLALPALPRERTHEDGRLLRHVERLFGQPEQALEPAFVDTPWGPAVDLPLDPADVVDEAALHAVAAALDRLPGGALDAVVQVELVASAPRVRLTHAR